MDIQFVGAADRIELFAQPSRQAVGVVVVIEADVKCRFGFGRGYIARLIAYINGGDLNITWLKMCVAVIKVRCSETAQHGNQAGQWIVGELRIGGVALGAKYGEARVQTAASANLDHIAEMFGIGRLANQAEINLLIIFLQPLEQGARAIDRRAFFIASDQQADGTFRWIGVGAQKACGGGDEGGDCALHVAGATTK